MKEIEMERGMGEMGKRIGSFYMRVGIFVSMYLTSFSFSSISFKREEIKKKQFNKVTTLFFFLDISPTPSTPKTPSISSLHPAHHSATKLSNGSTPPKPLFCCMLSHVYTSNGINTMEMSKKLYKDSVGM